MNNSHYGFGLAVSAGRIRLAAAGADHKLIKKEEALPLSFIDEKGVTRPFGITDWLSNYQVICTTKNGEFEHRDTNVILTQTVKKVIERMHADVHENIESILVPVPHALSEKKRFLLQTVIRKAGPEVQFINEDRAMMVANPDVINHDSLLIFNLRADAVEISYYQNKTGVLKQVEIETFENSGRNDIDRRLILSLGNTSEINLPWKQMEGLYDAVAQSQRKWRPPSTLTVDPVRLPQGFSSQISSDTVLAIFEEVLGPAYFATQKMITQYKQRPKIVLLSRLPVSIPIIRLLQQSTGAEVVLQGRDRLLHGAANYARTLPGKNQAPSPDPAPKVKLVKLETPETPAPEKKHSNSIQKSSPLRKTTASTIEDVRRVMHRVIKALEPCDTEQIDHMIPGLLEVSEELGARALNLWAKKLSDNHEFEKAYGIYKRYWRKNGGYAYLGGQAAGLCLAQARAAFQKGQHKSAKRWCNRGLRFNPTNKEWVQTFRAIKQQINRNK